MKILGLLEKYKFLDDITIVDAHGVEWDPYALYTEIEQAIADDPNYLEEDEPDYEQSDGCLYKLQADGSRAAEADFSINYH